MSDLTDKIREIGKNLYEYPESVMDIRQNYNGYGGGHIETEIRFMEGYRGHSVENKQLNKKLLLLEDI